MAVIQIKRGLQEAVTNLVLAPGELAVALDTGNVYIGTTTGNVHINPKGGTADQASKLSTPRQFSASGNLALQGPMEVIPMVIVGGTSMAGGRGGALKTVGGVVLLNNINNTKTMISIPAPLQPF